MFPRRDEGFRALVPGSSENVCIQCGKEGDGLDAYEFIRKAIIQGDYEPGQRLTEEFLAGELNLSRTPIREAIRRLEAEGLVTPLKRGVMVRAYTREDVEQIYDLRALLEAHAAGRAAHHRTQVDIAALREAHAAFERAVARYRPRHREGIEDVVHWNGVFHDHVVRAAANPHIGFLLEKVVALPLVFQSFYWYDEREVHRSLETHAAILKAIERQDADWARAAMAQHIYQGRDHVLAHIPATGTSIRTGGETE